MRKDPIGLRLQPVLGGDARASLGADVEVSGDFVLHYDLFAHPQSVCESVSVCGVVSEIMYRATMD